MSTLSQGLMANRRTARRRLPRIRGAVLSIVLHSVLLFISYIVQSMLLPYMKLSATPLIIPLAAISIAMFEGATKGAVFGLAAGAIMDLSFLNPISRFMMIMTIACLIIGALCDKILARGFIPYFILSVIMLAVCAFFQLFEMLVFGRVPALSLLRVAAVQTLFSLPFTLVIYPAARVAARQLRNSQ